MKLDSGEEQVFQPGDVVLLEDTIRPGHQMFVSDHRDLVVMFVTLHRKHHDIGHEHLSIQLATLKKRNASSCGDRGNSMVAFVTQLQAMEWNDRRTRMVFVGIVSLSLSSHAANFLAKTAPLWLAVGFGGTVFVAGATWGLTMLVETIFTRLHLDMIRRRLDRRQTEMK